MHAVDTFGIEEDWSRLVDFSDLKLKNSWYSSSKILDFDLSNVDT